MLKNFFWGFIAGILANGPVMAGSAEMDRRAADQASFTALGGVEKSGGRDAGSGTALITGQAGIPGLAQVQEELARRMEVTDELNSLIDQAKGMSVELAPVDVSVQIGRDGTETTHATYKDNNDLTITRKPGEWNPPPCNEPPCPVYDLALYPPGFIRGPLQFDNLQQNINMFQFGKPSTDQKKKTGVEVKADGLWMPPPVNNLYVKVDKDFVRTIGQSRSVGNMIQYSEYTQKPVKVGSQRKVDRQHGAYTLYIARYEDGTISQRREYDSDASTDRKKPVKKPRREDSYDEVKVTADLSNDPYVVRPIPVDPQTVTIKRFNDLSQQLKLTDKVPTPVPTTWITQKDEQKKVKIDGKLHIETTVNYDKKNRESYSYPIPQGDNFVPTRFNQHLEFSQGGREFSFDIQRDGDFNRVVADNKTGKKIKQKPVSITKSEILYEDGTTAQSITATYDDGTFSTYVRSGATVISHESVKASDGKLVTVTRAHTSNVDGTRTHYMTAMVTPLPIRLPPVEIKPPVDRKPMPPIQVKPVPPKPKPVLRPGDLKPVEMTFPTAGPTPKK